MKTAILSLITALTPFTPVEHSLKRFLSIKQLFLRIAGFFKTSYSFLKCIDFPDINRSFSQLPGTLLQLDNVTLSNTSCELSGIPSRSKREMVSS